MTSPPEPPSHEPQLQDLGEMDEHRAFLISAGVCTSCADDYNAFVSKAKAAAHKPKPPSPYFFIMLEKETSANDAKEYASFMPLHWAATVGQIEIVRLLLGANAAVDSKTSSSGRTPLHLAAHNGHHEIVRLLLDANADMDLDTSYGKNFLHSAVDGFDSVYEAQYSAKLDDHFLVVRLLVDTKASTSTDSPDPHISTIFKALSLKGVSEQNRIRILDCLIEKVVDKGKVLNVLYEDDFIFPKEESPLYHAIRKDSLDAARYLVDKGADPLLECAASLSDLHQLPIHLAIRKDGRNTLELVRQMVNKEPKLIDTLTSRGESCLYLSVCKGDVECTEYLLSQSAAWPPQDHDGSLSAWAKRSPSLKSPWQFAYSKRDWRIIGAFLKKERMVLHYRAHKSVVVKGIRHLTRESRIHRLGADELDGYNVSRAHKKDCAVTWFLPGGDELRWGGNQLLYTALDMQTCISSLGLTSSNYLAVLEVIENSFVGHNRTRGELSVREPTCTFERLQKHNNLNIMSISMPYFSSKTQELLAKRWKYTLKNSKKLLYCQTDNPQDFGADIEVTLDEYCNPSLDSKVLEKRNKDQVLTRYDQRALRSDPPLQDNSATPDQSSPRLVTVPQLWCWRIGPKLMLGGLSRHCPPQSKQYFGLNLNQVSEDNLDVFIGRLLSRHIDNLDRANLLGLSESIFSVFSWSIATVAEDVNKYTLSTAFGDISIDAEKKYLHEINDIREEIAMIRTVIFQQEEIWKEFTYNTWPEYWPDGENGRFKPIFEPSEAEIWREIAKPQAQLPKYQKRLEKLDDDAERVERHILVQLDLKQKHTAIKEAHTTTVMSAAIVGFTVITIIFTPLSFLASLFALPIDQFQGGPNTTYTTNYIGKWMATGELVSLAVTAAAIWIACEYFLEVRVSSTIWQWLRSLRGVPYTPRWLPQPLDSKVGEGHVSNTKSSMKTASALPTVVEGSQGTRKIETNLKWRHQLPALKLPNFRQIRKLRRQKSDNGDSSISLQEV